MKNGCSYHKELRRDGKLRSLEASSTCGCVVGFITIPSDLILEVNFSVFSIKKLVEKIVIKLWANKYRI